MRLSKTNPAKMGINSNDCSKTLSSSLPHDLDSGSLTKNASTLSGLFLSLRAPWENVTAVMKVSLLIED